MQLNMYLWLIVAIIPIITGFIYYNPKTFGAAWLNAIGKSGEEMKANGGNMFVLFGSVYFFCLIFGVFVVTGLCIHQFGAMGMIGGEANETTKASFQAFMSDYGTAFRSLKHGALHGTFLGIAGTLFFVGVPALFEQRSWKYILIALGYNVFTCAIMGAVLCQYL